MLGLELLLKAYSAGVGIFGLVCACWSSCLYLVGIEVFL